jgi:hypothetical protein
VSGLRTDLGKSERKVRNNKTVDIAKSLEPATPHGSFVSKLNRWKKPYALIDWTSCEDITLTRLGSEKRGMLLPLVRKEKRLEQVSDAIFAVTGTRACY